MIEARNWLRRIRVSKWSLNFVGPGFVASFKGLVVHSDRPHGGFALLVLGPKVTEVVALPLPTSYFLR